MKKVPPAPRNASNLEKTLAGVRVNTVSPGMIATGFHDTFTKPEVRAAVANACLLKREGGAEEVASTIAFLASSDASYLTGVAVDSRASALDGDSAS